MVQPIRVLQLKAGALAHTVAHTLVLASDASLLHSRQRGVQVRSTRFFKGFRRDEYSWDAQDWHIDGEADYQKFLTVATEIAEALVKKPQGLWLDLLPGSLEEVTGSTSDAFFPDYWAYVLHHLAWQEHRVVPYECTVEWLKGADFEGAEFLVTSLLPDVGRATVEALAALADRESADQPACHRAKQVSGAMACAGEDDRQRSAPEVPGVQASQPVADTNAAGAPREIRLTSIDDHLHAAVQAGACLLRVRVIEREYETETLSVSAHWAENETTEYFYCVDNREVAAKLTRVFNKKLGENTVGERRQRKVFFDWHDASQIDDAERFLIGEAIDRLAKDVNSYIVGSHFDHVAACDDARIGWYIRPSDVPLYCAESPLCSACLYHQASIWEERLASTEMGSKHASSQRTTSPEKPLRLELGGGPYFLTVRLPYMLLGADAANDPDRIMEPALTHERESHVFYEVDSEAIGEKLLEMFRYATPEPGIPGDRSAPVGSLEGVLDLVEGACQPIFGLVRAADMDLPQRVLLREQIGVFQQIESVCDWDPGVWAAGGLPHDKRTVVLMHHRYHAQQWEPLIREELAAGGEAQQGVSEGRGKERGVYLWFTWGTVMPLGPDDDMNEKFYFYKVDSEELASRLTEMFQKSEGNKLFFSFTAGTAIPPSDAILADDSVDGYRKPGPGIDGDFFAKARRWEHRLRADMALEPLAEEADDRGSTPAEGEGQSRSAWSSTPNDTDRAGRKESESRTHHERDRRPPAAQADPPIERNAGITPYGRAIAKVLKIADRSWRRVCGENFSYAEKRAFLLLVQTGLMEARVDAKARVEGWPQAVRLRATVNGDFRCTLLEQVLRAVPDWLTKEGALTGRCLYRFDFAEGRLTEEGERARNDLAHSAYPILGALMQGRAPNTSAAGVISGTFVVDKCDIELLETFDGQATSFLRFAPILSSSLPDPHVSALGPGDLPSRVDEAAKEQASQRLIREDMLHFGAAQNEVGDAVTKGDLPRVLHVLEADLRYWADTAKEWVLQLFHDYEIEGRGILGSGILPFWLGRPIAGAWEALDILEITRGTDCAGVFFRRLDPFFTERDTFAEFCGSFAGFPEDTEFAEFMGDVSDQCKALRKLCRSVADYVRLFRCQLSPVPSAPATWGIAKGRERKIDSRGLIGDEKIWAHADVLTLTVDQVHAVLAAWDREVSRLATSGVLIFDAEDSSFLRWLKDGCPREGRQPATIAEMLMQQVYLIATALGEDPAPMWDYTMAAVDGADLGNDTELQDAAIRALDSLGARQELLRQKLWLVDRDPEECTLDEAVSLVSTAQPRAAAPIAETALGKEGDASSNQAAVPPEGEWVGPVTKGEIARRISRGQTQRWRKVQSMFPEGYVTGVTPKTFRFRIDHLDKPTQALCRGKPVAGQ